MTLRTTCLVFCIALLGGPGCGDDDPNDPVVCEVGGDVLDPGDTVDAPDGCNTCTCQPDGTLACTEIACVDGGPQPGCTVDGATYAVGETFPNPASECSECVCQADGSTACDDCTDPTDDGGVDPDDSGTEDDGGL